MFLLKNFVLQSPIVFLRKEPGRRGHDPTPRSSKSSISPPWEGLPSDHPILNRGPDHLIKFAILSMIGFGVA